MMYEEATSGEESPRYNFTDSSDGSYYDHRRSDDENEFSNSSDKEYDSSDDEDQDSEDSEDSNNSDSDRESSKSSNNRKKNKKSYQMEEENQNKSDKQTKKMNKHHSDDEDSCGFISNNKDNTEKKSKNQNMNDENDEHIIEQEYPEQGNLLYQLQSKMALEKKNMQRDRQISSSSSRERKKKMQKSNDSKKKGIQKSKHKKKSKDSPQRKKSKKLTEKQKSIMRKRLNEDNFSKKGSKDVASLEDIYLNFFDFHSYDIVSSLKEAEQYSDIPKIYIEDPQNECDEHEIYKIVTSLSKLDTSAVKNKKKVKNFSIIFVENVKVLIFDFYRKTTALIVSKSLLDLPTKNNRNLLPRSLKFKWALDKRANPEYLKRYYACIFRNIPNFTAQQISQFILNKHPHLKLKCVEEPTYIKNQYCTIAQFESVEDCEYACTVFHKQNWINPKYKVKCNIHPKCSFARNVLAKEDKNKIFFVQSNILKRCKLFKCRMKREWFEDQLLPPQLKQEDITYKNSNLRFQKIKLPNSFISSDDLSDEDSFQEYKFLYQENLNKSNKQNKNNFSNYNSQHSNNNNNFSNFHGNNNNNSSNQNTSQQSNNFSNNNSNANSNNNHHHHQSSRFHNGNNNNSNSNSNNNNNNNGSNNNSSGNQPSNQNTTSGSKQSENDPLSILRQSSQMNSNSYQSMRTNQDGRKSNNNNFSEEKQIQNQQKQKGVSNVKLNDILKNSSGMIGIQYQEDMQQSKQSSSSMLQSTNDSHSYQNREEEVQNDVGISSTLHSSRAMNIYGSNQSSSKNNRSDRDKDQNNSKQSSKRSNDNKNQLSQQEEKSSKNSGKQNIQSFEQIKKMSKTDSQTSSKFQNSQPAQSQQQQQQSQQPSQIQVNQILTNSSSIPPNSQLQQQQQVIQNPQAIQPIPSQGVQQIQIGIQINQSATIPQGTQQIPGMVIQAQQISNRNQGIPQQFPSQPNQPQLVTMGQIQPIQQQSQIMQPVMPGQIQGQVQQNQQAYQVLPQQAQVNQYIQGQVGQIPMQQPIFQGMVQQIPNSQGAAIIQSQPVPYGMIQNPQTGQVIPTIVQQVQPNMVQQPQIVLGQQPLYGQAHGYRIQGAQIQMQNVQQIPQHQIIQGKQPQPLVYGQPTIQTLVFGQPPQQIIHPHPHMTVVNQNMIQPGQIIQPTQNQTLGVPQQIPTIIQQYPSNQMGIIQGAQPVINPAEQQAKPAVSQPTQEEKRLQLLKELINPSNQHAPQPPQEQAPNTPSTPPTPPSPPTPPPEPV